MTIKAMLNHCPAMREWHPGLGRAAPGLPCRLSGAFANWLRRNTINLVFGAFNCGVFSLSGACHRYVSCGIWSFVACKVEVMFSRDVSRMQQYTINVGWISFPVRSSSRSMK